MKRGSGCPSATVNHPIDGDKVIVAKGHLITVVIFCPALVEE